MNKMIVQKNTNQHFFILEYLFNVQEICWKNRLVCLQIVDTGGAFLPLQSDIFLRGGRGFANQALMSSQGIQQVNQTLPLQIVDISSLNKSFFLEGRGGVVIDKLDCLFILFL